MLAIVTWKWQPALGYRSTFGPEAVNVLAAMVRRHYPHPHRVICVTDEPEGIQPGIEIVPAWNDFAHLPSPHGAKNPSCYRRLRMFDPEIGRVFGERFVSIDLDVVLTADVSSLWNRSEDFVAWGDTNPQPGSHYNGSMMLLRAGARPKVWTTFNPDRSPREALRAGSWGSDQGWISYCLGPGEAKWGKADGVYSFRNDFEQPHRRDLPANAKIVSFHGRFDPWHESAQQRYPWIAQHWRPEEVPC